MKRLFLMVSPVVTVVALAWFAGCSDNSTESIVAPESQHSSDSTFITSLFGDDDLFGTAFESYSVSFALLDSIPGGSAPKRSGAIKALDDGDEVTITAIASYNYSNGWHIFTFEGTVVNVTTHDTVDISGIDSVKVIEDGLPVQFPNETTVIDELHARTHVDMDDRAGTAHGDLHHAVEFSISNVGDDTILTIDGSAHDSLSGSDGDAGDTCELVLTIDQTITNLQIAAESQDGDCPLTGYVAATVSMDINCTSGSQTTLSISGTWSITATVNGDNTVTITYTDGTTTWATTEPCTGGGSGSSPFPWK